MPRPDPSEYAPYHIRYVSLIPDETIVESLNSDLQTSLAFLRSVLEADACVRHAPYTWSTKEVVGHMTDTEWVFGYRALRFARGDSTPLAGFDENAFTKTAQFDQYPLSVLVAQFEAVRRSHLEFFGNLPEVAWARRGIANGDEVSVRALAYILLGHERHHMAILRQRLAKG